MLPDNESKIKMDIDSSKINETSELNRLFSNQKNFNEIVKNEDTLNKNTNS